MANKKIAIIGANAQQAPLILKVKEMGFQTYVFAWQAGDEIGEKAADFFIPISTEKKELILEKCKELEIDAVISIGSDMAALTAAYIAEKMEFPTNSYNSLRSVTNKIVFRNRLSELGILQPRYMEISDIIDRESLAELKFPVVVKPSDRSGGRGLKKVVKETLLYSAINYAREVSFEHKAIVEEYIDGQMYSCECISEDGKHRILGYTKRELIEINGQMCENEYSAPANIPLSVANQMETISKKILNSFNLLNGASSIEFLISNGKIYVIEVTPTMYGDFIGTDIVPKAYGFDYLKMIVDIATGNKIDYTKTDDIYTTCVHFVYSKECGFSEAPQIPDGNRYGHYITLKSIKEYGGVKPFVFTMLSSYYTENENTVMLNSEYTAFWYALKACKAKTVHIPYYAPSAYGKVADELGVECKHYHINQNFLPVDLNPLEDDAVLLINYFGLCRDFIKKFDAKYKIIDNTTVFYEKPLFCKGVYNIYSCRKFFSVPDGAYLVSENIEKISLKRDVSYKRTMALMMSAELGENAAYKEQQTNDQELLAKKARMSVLTEKMMLAQNYENEQKIRLDNFKELHSVLEKYNLLEFKLNDVIPQAYPLLIDADIREYLINKKIYIPVMWRKLICDEFSATCEKLFSEKLLCLPIDSHYNVEDMKYIADIVLNLLT